MIKRMIGAAKLDIATYEEVEADTSATRQAMVVVVLVALATGIASSDRAAQRDSLSVSSQEYAFGRFGRGLLTS